MIKERQTMLLVADIGNSQVTIGVYDKENLLFRWGLTSAKLFSEDEYGILLFNLLDKEHISDKIHGAVVSSVVSHLTYELKTAIEKYLKLSPIMVNHKIKMGGVTLKVDRPEEVGPDRICNIVAAYKMYKAPLVVVDMGTATTFDVVNKNGEFIGGTISPGVGLSARTLANNTSLLPDIQIDYATRVIATNTETNILAGTVIAHAAMTDGMLDRIEEELGSNVTTVTTGGYSIYVEEHMKRKVDHHSSQLTMDGLRYLYHLNIIH